MKTSEWIVALTTLAMAAVCVEGAARSAAAHERTPSSTTHRPARTIRSLARDAIDVPLGIAAPPPEPAAPVRKVPKALPPLPALGQPHAPDAPAAEIYAPFVPTSALTWDQLFPDVSSRATASRDGSTAACFDQLQGMHGTTPCPRATAAALAR